MFFGVYRYVEDYLGKFVVNFKKALSLWCLVSYLFILIEFFLKIVNFLMIILDIFWGIFF